MISKDKKLRIQAELLKLEKEEEITILWACESGSRAWGFASRDSDYDVRFIYLRQSKDYLRVSPLRDVIEKPISEDLDISGWDLPKALGLFRKSNPPLLEWLQSPIVYKEFKGFKKALSGMMAEYFSPIGCMYHYLSMANRGRRSYLEKDEIKLKKYFYLLRPVLACMWIQQGRGVVPIEFRTLVETLISDPKLKKAIADLLQKKMSGDEIDTGPQIPVISNFISDQMNNFSESTKTAQFTKNWENLDRLFCETLVAVNGPLIN